MSRPVVVVLYENHRDQARNFGLHELVLACVQDRLGERAGTRFALREAVPGIPRNGNAKLQKSCQRDLPRIARGGARVVAVFDDDRVRRLLGLPADAPGAEVVRHLKGECPLPEALSVVLLRRNLETVLRAAGRCAQVDGAFLAEALGKNLEARDAILNRVAWSDPPAVRACILAEVPDLAQLVELICDALVAAAVG